MERVLREQQPQQKYVWPTPDSGVTPPRAVIVAGMVLEETQVIPVQIDIKTGRVIGHR